MYDTFSLSMGTQGGLLAIATLSRRAALRLLRACSAMR